MSSDQLADIGKRIAATRQLETVFTAMRGLAAARSREAQKSLDGVRSYAHAVGEAIQTALVCAPNEPVTPPAAPKHIVLAFCSEQGFVGAFDERVLRAATRAGSPASFYVVGQKGKASAIEHGVTVAWSTPMAAHAVDAPAVAERIADALYEEVASGERTHVTLVHMAPSVVSGLDIVTRPLIPLDLARFPAASNRAPPIFNLSPPLLLSELAEEYVFAELCEATLLSFASENFARMQAMSSARSNVRKTLDELTARHRQLRQEQITEELMELSRSSGV
ncbi:F0F1 ATP synthase subunit gamma [Methylocystis sp. MJC1]|jgi:F-type H+-transporting ATPase subunit gamma|uniref:F0F1 ATP synthase subunit gamma n=1 Tax=Methylocystis sp. MJC1 TaxID=2654282 RepID=UPI0013ED082A|nr:F0F1 ATP synthase subunit gamma [Methylocystis sp. MJC1]KAF2989890.1 ATP synthase gamma chain [Methylocystis sp. MJC1]MBU6528341.1 F0F1 ATP synthase subunit gamma [Methylocystis sp. MJC1]UZX11246.1 F0F1 ATP synthase subunit gamma [Methylocystis sp. MJC1]